VRIAPEEQGEYEEVLDEDSNGRTIGRLSYKPAKSINDLTRVGGDEWLRQKVEVDMAKEFEKLTLRTYTPLTIDMASEVEELTGTPYTLKDENLAMAQTIHDVTKRPYTKYNFGLQRKATGPSELRNRFSQAVAEVFALKQAGLDMDLSKFANRGVYNPPRWVKDIKLARTESGELVLELPRYKSLDEFLEVMQTAPEWEATPIEEEELLVEEAEDHLDPVLPQEQLPTMDPATPEFKREAVVKMDSEKKPFDFMSNRPVPRAKPVPEPEPVVEEVVVQEPPSPEGDLVTSPLTRAAETEPVNEVAPAAASESRHSILQDRAERLAEDFAALKESVQGSKSGASATKTEEMRWRQIPVTDVAVKFALFKRIFQLTGIRISDPKLTSTDTLGDLYSHLCEAAKPQPTSLFTALHVEGQKARERAKKLQTTSTPDTTAPRRRADLGDLINLGNVELRRVKPTKTEKRTKSGQQKVIQYALQERGLGGAFSSSMRRSKGKKKAMQELSMKTDFGKALSAKGVKYLERDVQQ
jgi:actin-related protein 6